MVKPAGHPGPRAVAAHYPGGLRIDVEPRVIRVVDPDQDHRQRFRPLAIDVVRVVLIDDTRFGQTGRLRRFRHDVEDPLTVELRARRSGDRYDARLSPAERRQIHRLAREHRELQVLDRRAPQFRQHRARILRGEGLQLRTSAQRLRDVRRQR